MLANLNGELEFVTRLAVEMLAHKEVLRARRAVLVADQAAVRATLRQFDPEVDVERIGTAQYWTRGLDARDMRTAADLYVKRLRLPLN